MVDAAGQLRAGRQARAPKHHHVERHHQGLDGALPEPGKGGTSTDGPVVCRERLGGVLKQYYREAA